MLTAASETARIMSPLGTAGILADQLHEPCHRFIDPAGQTGVDEVDLQQKEARRCGFLPRGPARRDEPYLVGPDRPP